MNICANILNKTLANNIQQQSINKQDTIIMIGHNHGKEKNYHFPRW